MILGTSAISESAILEQVGEVVGAYLLVGAESSTTNVYNYVSTGTLGVLSYSTNYEIYFGGNTGAWLVPLEIAATSVVSNAYVYQTTATLELSISYITSTTFKFIDSTGYEIGLIDDVYRSTDPPSERWRNRPTLMLGPIGFNPLGVEQWLGPEVNLYPYFDNAPVEIASVYATSATVSRITTAGIEFGDQSLQEITLSDISIPELEIAARTFTKEYTFLKQYSYNETIGMNLVAESSESLRINAGGTTAPRQVWFG